MISKRCNRCEYEWISTMEQCPRCFTIDYSICGFGVQSSMSRDDATPACGVVTAASILRKGAGHIEDRAASRDCVESGERSMSKTVKAFNALYGHELTEEQGWQFMCILKKARASQGGYNADDYEDDAAYAALAGECAGAQA